MLTYLNLDGWKVKDGLCLLCRIDPDLSSIGWPGPPDWTGVAYPEVTVNACHLTYENHSIGSEQNDGSEQTQLKIIEVKLRRLHKIWESGNHKMKNKPAYYVQWALSKGFTVEWLDWAIQKGLFPNFSQSTFDKAAFDMATKELEGRGESTVLQMLGCLLLDKYEMDIHAKKLEGVDALRLRFETYGFQISNETIGKWIHRASDALKDKKKRRK